MKTVRIEMSAHAIDDRLDRLTEIAMTIGFGEELLTVVDPIRKNGTCEVLTTTGVLLVKDIKSGRLVTAFVANVQQVSRIYKLRGYTRIPPHMMTVVKNNERSKKRK